MNIASFVGIVWEEGINWEDGIEWEEGYTGVDEVYYPRRFSFDPIRYSTTSVVDQLRLQIDNVDQYFSVIFTGNVVIGSPVKLRKVFLNDQSVVIGSPLMQFEGQIDAWDLDESVLNITVTNDFVAWAQQTLSKHSASCRWLKFKGTECGYDGAETWCDRSYARCKELGNTDNFGGFRFLPQLMDKEIWWGRVQA